MAATHTIIHTRRGIERTKIGTIQELVEYYGYTLDKGASWQHEKGNAKISRSPKTIGSLIKNLNNAVNNAAANGFANEHFALSA